MKMMQRMVALVALLMLAVVPAIANATPGVVITDSVTLQTAPGTEGGTVELENGTFVESLGEQSGWYKVSVYDSASKATVEGYVLKGNIVENPEYATGKASANIYTMPDNTSKIVGTIEAGEQLVVLGVWEDYLAVNLRTASGFVKISDVLYNGVLPTAKPAQTARPTATPTAEASLPVRYMAVRDTAMYTQPTSSGGSTGTMVAGSMVTITEVYNGYGYDIDSRHWLPMRNLVRYVPGETIAVETSEPTTLFAVVTNGAEVREAPDASAAVVDTLAADTTVVVGQRQNGYGKVSYGSGQGGWMLISDLLQLSR